jgi:hypothetical protein
MTTIQKRHLNPQPHRTVELLRLLASSPHGATEALVVRVHGFDSDMVGGLVRAGLATPEREASMPEKCYKFCVGSDRSPYPTDDPNAIKGKASPTLPGGANFFWC